MTALSYDKTLEYLKKVRDKYSNQVLSQKGVHAIGVRVHDYRIVVYVNDMSAEIIQTIPLFLDEIPVEIVLQEAPPSLCFSGGDRITPRLGFVTWGTLGSVWFSTKYKQLVGLSNNHVLAEEDMLAKRSISAPVSVTVGWGGTVPDPEVGYFDQDFPNNGTLGTTGAQITGISVWDGETWVDTTEILTGRYVVIRGENFGKEYFFGQNKLFFNDKQIPHYYWSNNAVIFVVPSNLPFSGELKIQAEGARILVEDRKSDNKQVNLGELLDYCEVTHTPVDGYDPEIDYHWQWEAECSADVAICSITPSLLSEAELQIVERSSYETTDKLYNYYMAGQRSHTITGIAQNVKEFTPVMFVGGRGTIYCHVTDPAVRCIMDYAKGISALNETIMYQYTGMTTGIDLGPFPPSSGGSSGSSVIVADIDNLLDYYDQWGIIPPTREQMESALKDDLGNQINFPDYFIGNNFAGITWDYMGFSDLATNWIDRMQILPVSMVPQIDAEDSPMVANNTMTATPTLVSSGSQINSSASFTGVSSLTASGTTENPIATLTASATFIGASNVGATAVLKVASQNKIVDFDLIKVSVVSPNAVDFNLQPLTSTTIGTNANFIASSTLSATAGVIGQIANLLASATFSGKTSFQAYIPGSGNTHYENIYFEITRTQDIYFEITRTQDINTEITRSVDLNLVV